VAAAWLVIHFWVYIFAHPSTVDLTREQRKAVMVSALSGRQGVAALTARGMTVLQRDDVAEVARSRCSAETVCTLTRRGRRELIESCAELTVNLFCAYEITDTSGRAVAGLVKTGRGRYWPAIPELSGASSEFVHAFVRTERPDQAIARRKLCDMDYCNPADLLRWQKPVIAPPVDPDQEARARCKGALADVVGKGKVCLDPSDPAKRAFQDCTGGFCGPRMVAVPRGRGARGVSDAELAKLKVDFPDFTQLGKDEHPQREVTIGYDLAIGVLEITFEEWDNCIRDSGCQKPGPRDAGWGRGQRPVINVSWRDINADYLPWLNAKLGLTGTDAYRLISDGEWEYAARGGTTSRYAFGDRLTRQDANFHDAHFTAPLGTTASAGSLRANAFGLHDMHGNVAEWVEDCLVFLSSIDELPRDGSARTRNSFGKACSGSDMRVFRGGSFASGAHGVRSASRGLVAADTRSDQIGFRVARTLYRPRHLDQKEAAKGPKFRE
jgi:formylglycine-generating enzyme required for sulfatase activity